MRPTLWRVAFGAALLAVAWTSLLPLDDLLLEVPLSDRAIHVLAYAGLGALAVLSALRWQVAVIAVVAFGLLMEVAQGLSGYRGFEWADLLADAVGAALGAGLATVLRRTRRADRVPG